MNMRVQVIAVVIAGLLPCFAGCAGAPAGSGAAAPPARTVNSAYLWDADGHTDLALLIGLKAEAARYLGSNGMIISGSPYSTESYLKITLTSARKGEDGADGVVSGRMYILDAADGSLIYDSTYTAEGPPDKPGQMDYPVREFVRGALAGYLGR